MKTSGPIFQTNYIKLHTSAILKGLCSILYLRFLREDNFHFYMIRIAFGLARPLSSRLQAVFMIYHYVVEHTDRKIRVKTLKTSSEGGINAKRLITLSVTTYIAILYI